MLEDLSDEEELKSILTTLLFILFTFIIFNFLYQFNPQEFKKKTKLMWFVTGSYFWLFFISFCNR